RGAAAHLPPRGGVAPGARLRGVAREHLVTAAHVYGIVINAATLARSAASSSSRGHTSSGTSGSTSTSVSSTANAKLATSLPHSTAGLHSGCGAVQRQLPGAISSIRLLARRGRRRFSLVPRVARADRIHASAARRAGDRPSRPPPW